MSTDKIDGYAHPEKVVSTDWLQEHLGDPGLVVVESDEDVLLYETGHIPGAVKLDWHLDLNDPVIRDYRLLQYDLMFGKQHGAERFFPEAKHRGSST